MRDDSLNVLRSLDPQLRHLHADVACDVPQAAELFRRRSELQLHMRLLSLRSNGDTLPADLALGLRDTNVQPDLTGLELHDVDLSQNDALDGVIDAVVSRRCVRLSLSFCRLPPTATSALVHALNDGALTHLQMSLDFNIAGPADVAEATALADALRASATLKDLKLSVSSELPEPAVEVVLRALVGHHSIRSLDLEGISLRERPSACALLTAIVAADAPALTELKLQDAGFSDAGLAALLAALPRNSHLRFLDVSYTRDQSLESTRFLAAHILPALRANTSLHALRVGQPENDNSDEDNDYGSHSDNERGRTKQESLCCRSGAS